MSTNEKIIVESLPQEIGDVRSYRITMTVIVKFRSETADEAIEAMVKPYDEVVFK